MSGALNTCPRPAGVDKESLAALEKTDTHQRLLRKTHNEKKHNESFEYNTNDPLTHQTDYISALYIITYINRFMYIYIYISEG